MSASISVSMNELKFAVRWAALGKQVPPGLADELANAATTLAALHETAVAWRRTRFDALMSQEPFRALFGRLLMAPPSRPVTAKAARIMLDYARRAQGAEPSQ